MQWNDLTNERKIQFLRWMSESLTHTVKINIANLTYNFFVRALQSGETELNEEEIFDKLSPRVIEHLDHIMPFTTKIQEKIDSLESYDGSDERWEIDPD